MNFIARHLLLLALGASAAFSQTVGGLNPTTEPLPPSYQPPATTPDLSNPDPNAIHRLALMKVRFGPQVYDIVIELFPDHAPKTVANFVKNVESGFYKGLVFHRAIEDYLIQAGDSATKSDDNRDQWGLTQDYTIPGEFDLKHRPGAVAMARRPDEVNPNKESDGTQFYIAAGNLRALNGEYSVFGQVVYGLESVKRISRAVKDTNDAPLQRIEIVDMKIAEQKGPIAKPTNSKSRKTTKPEALKGPLEKFLERIW